MREKRVLKTFVAITVFLACICVYKPSFATFSLRVSPYEGGYDLRYGKLSYATGRVNKEVSVDISTDIGKQYRLIQTLLEPLSTAEGNSISQGSFVVYGIRGTNRYGTLNVEQEVSASLGRGVLYTSNETGVSDSFTLVYGLVPSSNMLPGSYRGRIAFVLEPIDSTQASVTVILNMFAEVDAESVVQIKTEAGSKNIYLKFDEQESRSANVLVDIKGGFGRQFRISQLATKQPVSSTGAQLSWEALNLICAGSQKGQAVSNFTPLSSAQQTIYNSSVDGQADAFEITYILADLPEQKAGIYKTSIKYFLEGLPGALPQLINTLNLEVEYPRIFDLIVTPEMGGAMSFRDLKPRQPPRVSETALEVKSNIGKPYQVSQRITSLFANKEGKTIPGKYFTLRTEGPDTEGILKYSNKTEVNIGEMVLFISDNIGSSEAFKVIYELAIPVDLQGGDYSTRITYSLLER